MADLLLPTRSTAGSLLARCAPPGVATNNITGKRYIDHWTEAGFECGTPIKNSGADAAMMRMEAARRVFPRRCSMRQRLKLDAMRSATTTSVRTRSAVSV